MCARTPAVSTGAVLITTPSGPDTDGTKPRDVLEGHTRDYLNVLVEESVANGEQQVRQ